MYLNSDMDGDGIISKSDLRNMLDAITDKLIEDYKKDIIIESVSLSLSFYMTSVFIAFT